ncbi:hypothetical protein LEMLEM_LOCUS8677 [Lemmus lemmus]
MPNLPRSRRTRIT